MPEENCESLKIS